MSRGRSMSRRWNRSRRWSIGRSRSRSSWYPQVKALVAEQWSEFVLRISNVMVKDSGHYECQVAQLTTLSHNSPCYPTLSHS